MKKIVIIEDNEVVARLYENKLKAKGDTVFVALDGTAGLELIHSVKPDMVMLDLMLPNMSGIEIIKKIRKDYRFSNLPIMAYSSADDSILEEAEAAGSTVVVSKNHSSLKEILGHFNELMDSTRSWQIYNPQHFGEEKQPAANGTEAARGQILIVEDDPITAKLVRDMVEKNEYAPIVVNDGQEALRLLSSEANFTAAIFDVDLPNIKGTDLLRYMRTEKRLLFVPVIIMTASENSIRIQLESYEAGATFFIPKPFNRFTFETLLKTLVRAKD